MKYEVIYDYYESDGPHTYRMKFNTEIEAMAWIDAGADDDYTGNYQLVRPGEVE